jgi:hypothetical protein
MIKKLITPGIIACSMLCLVSSSFGIESIATGDYNSTSTWQAGNIPGSGEVAVLRSHTVTLESNVAQGSIDSLNTTRAATNFVMNSGSSLTVTNELSVNWGNVNVNGGILNHTGSTAVYVGKLAASSFNMNGGSFSTHAQVVLGAGSTSNNVSSITINGGASFTTAGTFSLGGSNGTNTLDVFINDGDFTVNDVEATGSYASAEITVNGGNLTLTTANESTSIAATTSNGFGIQYESGSIVWSGVANLAEFNTFKSESYTTWVNAGSITSSLYTNLEIYNGLTYVEGVGAVLAATIFNGGNLNLAASWSSGLPATGNNGIIAADGSNGTTEFNFGIGSVVNQSAGTITSADGFNLTGGRWNLSGGRIDTRYLLSNGSGTVMNLSGGSVGLRDVSGAQHMGVANGGTWNISGPVVLDGTQATDPLQVNGSINIQSNWTGSWTYGIHTGDDWQNLFLTGAVKYKGEVLDQAGFQAKFEVSEGGGRSLSSLIHWPTSQTTTWFGILPAPIRRDRCR